MPSIWVSIGSTICHFGIERENKHKQSINIFLANASSFKSSLNGWMLEEIFFQVQEKEGRIERERERERKQLIGVSVFARFVYLLLCVLGAVWLGVRESPLCKNELLEVWIRGLILFFLCCNLFIGLDLYSCQGIYLLEA